jgi:2-polyprenyl-3-methyl-5-hydroxy-6-metoxy-1,4-benzoquinol methylase
MQPLSMKFNSSFAGDRGRAPLPFGCTLACPLSSQRPRRFEIATELTSRQRLAQAGAGIRSDIKLRERKALDNIAKYNVDRWRSLVSAGAVFTRPYLHLDKRTALDRLDTQGKLGDLTGKDVLCLASGGGQQSIAFALLGARVTVVDLSEEQLQRDAVAAAHCKLKVNLLQTDMRDLSSLSERSFDIVWHPYSLNFVPRVDEVFRQVARVLRTGGIYRFHCANPAFMGTRGSDWTGRGYAINLPYIDGAEVVYRDEDWVFGGEPPRQSISPCKEYRHTMSSLVKGLIAHGFLIADLAEENFGTPNSESAPGTPEHLSAFAPPWMVFWTKKEHDTGQ